MPSSEVSALWHLDHCPAIPPRCPLSTDPPLLHCPWAQLRPLLGSVRLGLIWDPTTSELDYQTWGWAQDSWLQLRFLPHHLP